MSISPSDIAAAAARLEGRVHRTAVVRSRQLDALVGAQIHLKTENLQRAGSFKIRGALNTILQLSEEQKRRGVISYSSGNHAQGVALASQMLGVAATIVVPEDIIAAKRHATEAYGARLVMAGRTSAERRQAAEDRCQRENLTMIPPYDDARIIAGQGTVARELLEQVPDLDAIVAPIGGGGLMAGIAIAAAGAPRRLQIIGVEPQDADDTQRSLQAGQRLRIAAPQTIADGLRAVEPGELTFPIIQKHVDQVVTVSESAIAQALVWLLERTKLLVEPSGAVALAAVLAGHIHLPGAHIGVILSGGNIGLDALAALLSQPGATPGAAPGTAPGSTPGN
jgi:threonine dehydratase